MKELREERPNRLAELSPSGEVFSTRRPNLLPEVGTGGSGSTIVEGRARSGSPDVILDNEKELRQVFQYISG